MTLNNSNQHRKSNYSDEENIPDEIKRDNFVLGEDRANN